MSAYITSIGTALPPYKISQQELLTFMKNNLSLDEKKAHDLEVLYRASGIQYRYSVIDDFGPSSNPALFNSNPTRKETPNVRSRMTIYAKEAIKLAVVAVNDCLKKTKIDHNEITHLLTVSCTGMEAPGLDIQLVEQLPLATHVERTAVNFMGCYGCFNALKLANHIVGHQPDAKVLIVSVELCSLHLQELTSSDNLLSNSLFGDGAGAVLVESKPAGKSLKIKAFHNDLSLKAKNEMEWKIGNHGFLMTLSTKIPDIIKKEINILSNNLLKKINLSIKDVHSLAIHPGGKSILKAIEEALGFLPQENQASHDVLRSFGNMSSATILFVLKQCLEMGIPSDHDKNILSFAFGPGITMESALFSYHLT